MRHQVWFYTEDDLNKFEGVEENAGYDLRASHDATIDPGHRGLIKTGLYTDFTPDVQIEIRSRSGLALKNGIMVLNSPGTIDSGYRGEIGVILLNTSHTDPFVVKKGDRIAQAVFMPVIHPTFHKVEAKELLSESERGESGFGQSGTK